MVRFRLQIALLGPIISSNLNTLGILAIKVIAKQIDSGKIGRLMVILCDPVALCLIFVCLVPIFILKIKFKKIIVKKLRTNYELFLFFTIPSPPYRGIILINIGILFFLNLALAIYAQKNKKSTTVY